MKNEIGFKYFKEQYKDYTLKHKLKALKRELKWAWQRAMVGFDTVDVINADIRFRQRMLLVLNEYKKNKFSLWNVPAESEHYNDLLKKYGYYFKEEEMNSIIDTMIWHLNMMDEDFAEKQITGKNCFDDDWEYCHDTYLKVGKIIIQNKNAFMKLFSLFYFDLWD